MFTTLLEGRMQSILKVIPGNLLQSCTAVLRITLPVRTHGGHRLSHALAPLTEPQFVQSFAVFLVDYYSQGIMATFFYFYLGISTAVLYFSYLLVAEPFLERRRRHLAFFLLFADVTLPYGYLPG